MTTVETLPLPSSTDLGVSDDSPRKESATSPRSTKPLPVMFILTSMPVGGAETLLVNLIRRMDRTRFAPQLCCLKELGPLGEVMSREIPAYANIIGGKYDVRVLGRLTKLLRRNHVAAVVTVGAGDKMFWGRLAARLAGVPVVLSAVHSTGWPDGIGRLNKLLTPITDAYIGVAAPHGQHLIEQEGFPPHKVRVIPNGVDVDQFSPWTDGTTVRRELGIAADAPVAGIVAALRPEKNHRQFLQAAAAVRREIPDAQFLIVGDGPERAPLEALTRELDLTKAVHFVGSRSDIPQLLAAMDVFVLTSRMEANPVSILEALATGKPVVAPNVGSIPESVIEGQTGNLTPPLNAEATASALINLLADPDLAHRLGTNGRQLVESRFSLDAMVQGYEDLIEGILASKR
jgi:glycosyltransferase involved in cell wall biosynthesis